MKHFLNFLIALLLAFMPAFAHAQSGGHVPTTDQPVVSWSGIGLWDYGNLQLNSAPPSCPTSEYVLSIDETFTPHCAQ
jgi:hypothetical protein